MLGTSAAWDVTQHWVDKAALQHGLLLSEFTRQRTHAKSFVSVSLFSMLERILLSNGQLKNE